MASSEKRSNRILIVDDEENIREILTEYLDEFGYDVTTAINGKDALQIYNKEHFDIIISDLVMKPMDGMELLSEIKKINHDALFIMITGYPSVDSAMEAIKKGARDYITKPFNIDEIKIKIERALLERSMKGSLKNIQGIVWALVISIPAWLLLGIILARSLK